MTARTLENALWKTDFLGRWADNEFLVILNGRSDGSVLGLRERVRHMLANNSIEWWGERRSLPVSIGEAVSLAEDTIKSILDRAQRSLDDASEWRALSASAGSHQSSGS